MSQAVGARTGSRAQIYKLFEVLRGTLMSQQLSLVLRMILSFSLSLSLRLEDAADCDR